MADLDPRGENRESWLAWAIEFGRRGLRPTGIITVHGPHAQPAHFMWGEAWCDVDGGTASGAVVEVEFRSGKARVRNRLAIWDVYSVRVWTKDDPEERWPILSVADMTPRHQRWLAAAQKVRARLKPARDGARAVPGTRLKV